MLAIRMSERRWIVCTLPEVTDGFFNFFRIVMPGYLLLNDSLVLHSSCVVGANGKAHVFLGMSGAGKSTTARLGGERLVIGDDINIFHVRDGKVWTQSAFLGGNPKLKAPFENEYEVDGFYWLHQDAKNWIQPINDLEFVKRMMMSIILWTGNPDVETPSQKVFDLIKKMLKQKNKYNLGFQANDSSFYELLETRSTP